MQAERAKLAEDVATATTRGRDLFAAAETEAARLVTAAQDLVVDADQRYADIYSAATTAGWTPTDLNALGFQPAAGTHRQRSGPRAAQARATTSVPQQPTAHDDRSTPATAP